MQERIAYQKLLKDFNRMEAVTENLQDEVKHLPLLSDVDELIPLLPDVDEFLCLRWTFYVVAGVEPVLWVWQRGMKVQHLGFKQS